jgi:hypothetical protein
MPVWMVVHEGRTAVMMLVSTVQCSIARHYMQVKSPMQKCSRNPESEEKRMVERGWHLIAAAFSGVTHWLPHAHTGASAVQHLATGTGLGLQQVAPSSWGHLIIAAVSSVTHL